MLGFPIWIRSRFRIPMKMLLRAGLVLATIAAQSAIAATDTPQWRGPNRDGTFPETRLLREWPKDGPALAWKIEGLGRGLSSISIAGGKVFTMGGRNGGQWLIAIDPATQKELWATKVSAKEEACEGTPTVSGGLVYALSTEGELLCAKAADGTEVWRKSFKNDFGNPARPGWGFAESPLADGDKLIVTPGSKEFLMVALNKATGALVWKTEWMGSGKGHEGAGYTGPVISNAAGVRQYVTMIGKGAIGVDAKTGKLLWHYNRVANDTAVIPTPLVWDDYVFVSSGYGAGAGLLKIEKAGAASASAPASNASKVAELEKKLADLNAEIARRRAARIQTKEGSPEYEKANEAVQSIKPEIAQAEEALDKARGGTGKSYAPVAFPGSPVIASEQYFLEAGTFQNHHGGMVRNGDYIYAGKGHNNGFPVCLEWKTGKLAWDQGRGPGKESAAVVTADGLLFFRYQDGIMALIEASPKGYAEKGAFKLATVDGPSWSHPVIYDGRLYLRDQNTLMCYDVRSK
jgi:outer membrane protein assembly factor BamB